MGAIAKIDERVQWRTDQLARAAVEEAANPHCHAGLDGECNWSECPQEANNRANYQQWCPLATKEDDR